MKIISLKLLLFLSLLQTGCVEKKQQVNNEAEAETQAPAPGSHTSQNSLDWAGTYSGTLPCASCPGIETTLTINNDQTYLLAKVYLEEDEPNIFTNSGKFRWNQAGKTITLLNEDKPNQYFVGENYLAKLDADGNRITGELSDNYLLRKEK